MLAAVGGGGGSMHKFKIIERSSDSIICISPISNSRFALLLSLCMVVACCIVVLQITIHFVLSHHPKKLYPLFEVFFSMSMVEAICQHL